MPLGNWSVLWLQSVRMCAIEWDITLIKMPSREDDESFVIAFYLMIWDLEHGSTEYEILHDYGCPYS